MEGLVIRLMKESDLERLAEIYTEVYKRFKVGEHWTVGKARGLIDYWLRSQPDLAFAAEIKGKIVGAFVAGIMPWWDGNHLVDGEIFVDPDFQGRGIGTRLCETMYETALDKYKVTFFETRTFSSGRSEFPPKWYRSQGFGVDKDIVLITGDVKSMLEKIKEKVK